MDMIKSFADKETEQLWNGKKSKAVPEQLREGAEAKLLSVDAATNEEELKVPPSNRAHKLVGKRDGQWSVSINKPYRVCFDFVDGDAYDVEITDYH